MIKEIVINYDSETITQETGKAICGMTCSE